MRKEVIFPESKDKKPLKVEAATTYILKILEDKETDEEKLVEEVIYEIANLVLSFEGARKLVRVLAVVVEKPQNVSDSKWKLFQRKLQSYFGISITELIDLEESATNDVEKLDSIILDMLRKGRTGAENVKEIPGIKKIMKAGLKKAMRLGEQGDKRRLIEICKRYHILSDTEIEVLKNA